MLNFKVDPKLRQYITVIIADLSFIQLGMHVAWLSPLLIQLKDKNQTVLPQMITDEQAAWLLSLSNFVAISAFLYNGYVADCLGRKYSIIIFAGLPRFINCFMFLFATNFWMLMFGRAMTGIADAFCCSICSAYASEIASKEIRGGLGAIAQIMSALGAMITLSVGPFLDYMTLTIVITCITVVTFIPLLFIPESPYMLYAKGRVKESTAVLTPLRNNDAIDEELIEYSLNLNSHEKINKFALLKDKIVLKCIGKVIILAIGLEMTGSNAVTFYLQSIFESTHTSVRPEISSMVIGCIQVLGCSITIAFTDRLGRKPILTSCLIGMTIGMIGLGTFFRLRDEHYEIAGFMNYLPLVSIILVLFCFNAGIGASFWILCAELFDGPSRALGVSFAVLVAATFAFLITRYVALITTIIGPAFTYWMFAACCVVTCLFIIFFIPETKGKTFSEIQRDMGRDNAAFVGTELIENQLKSDV